MPGAGEEVLAATERGLKDEKAAALSETAEGGGRGGRFAPGCGVECPELDWLVEPGCDIVGDDDDDDGDDDKGS